MSSVSIREEPRRQGDCWRRAEEHRLATLLRRQLGKEQGDWRATLLPSTVLKHWWLLELSHDGDSVAQQAWLDARPRGLRLRVAGALRSLRQQTPPSAY